MHQVAKEFKISSEALLELLHGMNIPAKSHMSTVEDETVDMIRKHFEVQKAALREEYAKKEKEIAKRRELTKSVDREEIQRKKTQRHKRGSQPKDGRVSREAVEVSVKRVMAMKGGGAKAKKRRRKQRSSEESSSASATPVSTPESTILKLLDDSVTVGDFAKLMQRAPADVIKACMDIGLMVSINQRLDADTAETVADEMGFVLERLDEHADEEEIVEHALEPRPPVVTVMGHVDHGKTSILDYIRRTNVVVGEHGGITQHMGAYEVVLPEGRMTFIDTPGHKAFTAMRARGIQITDIVVLVVAAGEGVMPQTIEAIDHAKAAGVPTIVAINKVDLPDANPDMIRQQLSSYGIAVEAWGGDTMEVLTSAKTGEGIDKLLESILVQAEMMELVAPRKGKVTGVVLEARLDHGLGPVATILVRSGTFRLGDSFIVGTHHGRARALLDEKGGRIIEALPSKAVRVAGISGVPRAGDTFQVAGSEKTAREMAGHKHDLSRKQDLGSSRRASLEDLFRLISEGETKELNLVIKGDVQGSIEALSDALGRLGTDEVRVNVVHQGVGVVSESDVLLASASEAIIIGFQVRPSPRASELAEKERVEIRSYRVIYECIEDIHQALEGLLAPEYREKARGRVEVRQIFHHPKAGTVAGCYVLDGSVDRGAKVRVLRDGVIVTDSKIATLKRFKDDVKEVQTGFECGITVENFGDVHKDDILEIYSTEEIARSLD